MIRFEPPCAETIRRLWPRVALDNLTYLAACRMGPRLGPADAAAWLSSEPGRLVFSGSVRRRGALVVIEPSRMYSHCAETVLVLERPACWRVPELTAVVAALRTIAIHELGFEKLELWVPSHRSAWRRAAERQGFELEVELDGACFADGHYQALCLYGLVAEEGRIQ